MLNAKTFQTRAARLARRMLLFSLQPLAFSLCFGQLDSPAFIAALPTNAVVSSGCNTQQDFMPGNPYSSARTTQSWAILQYGSVAATIFIPTNSYTVCNVTVPMYIGGGTPAGNVYAFFYGFNAGATNLPGTVLPGGSSTAQPVSQVTGTTLANSNNVTFTGFGCTLTAGTIYWFGVSNAVSSGNYLDLIVTGNENNTGLQDYWNGSAWEFNQNGGTYFNIKSQ